MKSSLRRCLPVVASLSVAVGCTSADGTASAEPAPSPSGKQAAYCRDLHKALPAKVNGLKRRTGGPASEFTAAWGDPAITLRCGVRRPLILTPGYKRYRPGSDTWEVNGVEWMPEQQPDGSVRCTTSKREAWVEVTVPEKFTGEGGGLALFEELSDAVRKTVPYGVI
ncbi:DUF3515 domain-containing protein [Streptomyces sp. NPDC001407]|uniref:DUF3515 domain-containing protein n=1 Tax=Streptomyces sp. NPDC001407 TaxID=3364573 RepID=UPI0036BBED5D